jgi:N-acetylneuraminic acid mutarotase
MTGLARRILLTAALAAGLGGAAERAPLWVAKAQLPFARAEASAVTAGGKIYVIGGNAADRDATGITQEYDPIANRWRDRAPMPDIASHAGAAVVNGKIYVVGGFVANVHAGAMTRVFEYDPGADRWRALAPLPSPRGSPGVVALDGKIHAIGGRDRQKRTVATHEIYDPATNTWSVAAPLPVARDHVGIAVAVGRIHVFGGRTDSQTDNVTRHDVYDPATNSWRQAAPMPTPRSAGAAGYVDGRIVYAGGECKDIPARTAFNELEIYDPAADRWTQLPPMPAARHAAATVAVADELYIIGGSGGCGGDNPSRETTALTLP